MIRIYLIRHGQTQWNKEGRYQGQIDTELSELGLEQAEKLGSFFKDYNFDCVIASPLKRAMITASKISKDLILDERLKEINHGPWEGKLSSEINEEELALWKSNPCALNIALAESLFDVQKRSVNAIYDYAKKFDNKTICVVAHDAVNKVILSYFLKLPLISFWNIKQDNTCVNIFDLEITKNSFECTLHTLNNTIHLNTLLNDTSKQAL